jgi:NAD(P)-dependent dehydrogenase (short-subunit alcohol dehydrogenase family)
MFEVSGKSIVITGGGGVLGGFLAKELARLGGKIAVLDIDEKSSGRIVEEIIKARGKAIALKCNVLEKQSLLEAREKVLKEFGKIDALLNAAGGNNPKATTEDEQFSETVVKSFFNLETEGLQFVLDLNVLSTILASQVFAEKMNAGSVIINFSSMNSFRPLTKIPAYSAAKAAVSNFTQWLANYLAKKQIRVNAIAPGFFLTKQNEFLLTNPDGSLTDRGKKILAHTPMERFGKPEDLLGTIAWLLSEESKFVTGIIVPIDGGFSAYSGV